MRTQTWFPVIQNRKFYSEILAQSIGRWHLRNFCLPCWTNSSALYLNIMKHGQQGQTRTKLLQSQAWDQQLEIINAWFVFCLTSNAFFYLFVLHSSGCHTKDPTSKTLSAGHKSWDQDSTFRSCGCLNHCITDTIIAVSLRTKANIYCLCSGISVRKVWFMVILFLDWHLHCFIPKVKK